MSDLRCDGIQLGFDRAGKGSALVLVHGSWSERSTWDPVFASLADHFDTVRYDRRGYGESQRPGVGPAMQVKDLLALIRALRLQDVILVGNSLGGIIAAGAALAAPELVKQVLVHEPPLFNLLESSPQHQTMAAKTRQGLTAALDAVRSCNHAQAARIYVEEVFGATGAWPFLPPEIQHGFLSNADGFLSDGTPGQEYEPSLADLRALGPRLALTRGIRSPTFLKTIAQRLCAELTDSSHLQFYAAGHVPHQTCPREFTAAVVKFAAEQRL
jgi:pimeloyl-ACP methyl ester carboxylesterase